MFGAKSVLDFGSIHGGQAHVSVPNGGFGLKLPSSISKHRDSNSIIWCGCHVSTLEPVARHDLRLCKNPKIRLLITNLLFE